MTLDDLILIGVGLGILGFRRKERNSPEPEKPVEPKKPTVERKPLGNRFTKGTYSFKIPDGWKPPEPPPEPTMTTGPGRTTPPPAPPTPGLVEATREGMVCVWRIVPPPSGGGFGTLERVCYFPNTP